MLSRVNIYFYMCLNLILAVRALVEDAINFLQPQTICGIPLAECVHFSQVITHMDTLLKDAGFESGLYNNLTLQFSAERAIVVAGE